MAGLNLDKLKVVINSRKQDRGEEVITLAGEGRAVMPKDTMLHKIVEAAKTGRPNEAIAVIKNVDSKANIQKPLPDYNAMKPDLSKHLINENNTSVQQSVQQTVSNNTTYRPPVDITNKLEEEKELGLYAEIERKNAEQRRLNSNYPVDNSLMQNRNINNNSIQQMNPLSLNENVLVENVEKRVLLNLNESLGAGIKDILKETVLELYTVNKIKDVLVENTDITKKMFNENKAYLKQLVIEIIRELQKK